MTALFLLFANFAWEKITMINGFVDLQNNGWMNTDFSEAGLTCERFKEITLDLVSKGTIAYCPTLITGDPEIYKKNFSVIAEAIKDPNIGSHILGIHLEGPFISPESGAV
ncbi:MAG: hypothetical protein JXN60_00560, partial [Lentisphaerae bacterium]|nr:hypothetical protein [Lentisphaerota bacterium]